MGQRKTILGFIVGASLGAIAGILLAPDTGINTRKKVMHKSNDLKDIVNDAVSDFSDKFQTDPQAEILPTDRYTLPKMNSDII